MTLPLSAIIKIELFFRQKRNTIKNLDKEANFKFTTNENYFHYTNPMRT